MTTALATLTQPLTVTEASDALYAALAARGVVTTTWKAGAPERTIIAGLAIIVAALSALISQIAASGFLLLARGAWLTIVALYVYGVTRSTGSFGTFTLHVHNAGGGSYTWAIGQLVVTQGGFTYRNTASVTVTGIITDATVAMQADQLGTAPNAAIGAITSLVTPVANITVDNTTACVGQDPEDDATLVLRCNEKLGVLSPNGARDAYAFVARSTTRADGSSVGVTRVRTVPDGVGGVDVYLATPSGGVPGTVGDLASDLGLIDDALQRQVVPLAITCRTHSAGTVPVAVTYELWISSTNTRTDEQLQADVTAALTTFLGDRPIGGDVIAPSAGKVYVSALQTVIGAAVTGTLKVAVTVPAADVAVGTTAAPVLSGAPTCIAIHRIVGAMI